MTKENNIRAILETHFTGFREDIIESAVKMIMDVTKVRHGRWNELPYSYECSVCGIIRPKEMTGKWHYCPNCGAIMDEVEE